MLARDYGSLGSRGTFIGEWNTREIISKIGSVGRDRDNAVVVSDILGGNIQAWGDEGMQRGRRLGTKGRSPGELMQPCQTALSADETVLAVADSGNNRVQLFDASTRKLRAVVGRKGQIRPGRMQAPEGVAFVDGRREIIVADTGNNRLQIFHVETLTMPPEDPSLQPARGSYGGGGGESYMELTSSSSVDGASQNGSEQSWQITPSSRGSVAAWVQSQTPPQNTTASGGNSRGIPSPATAAGGRSGTSVPRTGGIAAAEAAAADEGPEDTGDRSSRDCLLVFTGAEGVGRLRKRRTAGESEAAEGPLSQPCDVAYWRARPPAKRGKDGGHAAPAATVWAWTPTVPPWFRPLRLGRHLGSSLPATSLDGDEDEAKKVLLPTYSPSSQKSSAPSRGGDGKRSSRPLSGDQSGGRAPGDVGGAVGGAEPRFGAFIVRDLGLTDKLQLLFVDKTKEAVEAEIAAAHETADEKNDSVSALSGSQYVDEDSEGSDWMKHAMRSTAALQGEHGVGARLDGGDPTGGGETQPPSESLPSPPLQIAEVRDKFIAILDGGKGFEICGRVYDSLLSLLRGFRGRGFARLEGVTDTRGDRGLVAVAERGGGRVRLLHYAPAFPPFYPTELTHLHSIERLRRPSSVSFSIDGDLLVVDQGTGKMHIYSCLSGRWALVRDFGPGDRGGAAKRLGDATDRIASSQGENASSSGTEAGTKIGKHGGGESAHVEPFPPWPAARVAVASPTRGRGGRDVDAVVDTSRGQEQKVEKDFHPRQAGEAERKQEENHRMDRPDEEWGEGAPVSARFMRLKGGLSFVNTPQPDKICSPAATTEVELVVGTSDGLVRTLGGPKRRECGSFAPFAEVTVLSILEYLGYHSSQVLGHVNRTMADLRSRLRREWRLHPLTPGHLARRTLEFLQWGRLATGEGLPGRGTSVDEGGKQLCDRFLATSACSRPACPYSHLPPWIGPTPDNNSEACILFRGGVMHAINNLYGQVFGWEWEGVLHLLFHERSFLRTIVARRDPMTTGIHGAEIVRECVETVERVMDYPRFVDFATVVHEHVLGLRPWYQRPDPSASACRLSLGSVGGRIERPTNGERSAATLTRGGVKVGGGRQGTPMGNYTNPARKSDAGKRQSGREETLSAGGRLSGRKVRGMVPLPGDPTAGSKAVGDEAFLPLRLRSSSRPRSPNAATPWLSWDFSTPNETEARYSGTSGSAAVATSATAVVGAGDRSWQKRSGSKVGWEDAAHDDADQKRVERKEKGEEPKNNRRTYGEGQDEKCEASINKLIAFQTDRVVRMLDNMF